MKRKYWLIALAILGILLLASIPRVTEIRTADSEELRSFQFCLKPTEIYVMNIRFMKS